MSLVVRPSQEIHRRKRTILGEGRRNAGMVRQRQLETPLQKSMCESGNNMKKRKKKSAILI
jgi:hypothetical protein